jgi:hypothetical protein
MGILAGTYSGGLGVQVSRGMVTAIQDVLQQPRKNEQQEVRRWG